MSAEDAHQVVTLCERKRAGLYADDEGLSVRTSGSRAERFGWAEISRFAEGSGCDPQSGAGFWFVTVILQTGRKVRVGFMQGCVPTPEVLTAIRRVADRYGIPADVTGMTLRPGLYEDPGGEFGLRYWDGTQWSPVLPRDFSKPSRVRKSPASWPVLPMADGPWTYAADRVKYWTAWLIGLAAVSAALLATGLGVLWWDGVHHGHAGAGGWFIVGGIAALSAFTPWRPRRFCLKLDKVANRFTKVQR